MKRCKQCGKEIADNMRRCPSCGAANSDDFPRWNIGIIGCDNIVCLRCGFDVSSGAGKKQLNIQVMMNNKQQDPQQILLRVLLFIVYG